MTWTAPRVRVSGFDDVYTEKQIVNLVGDESIYHVFVGDTFIGDIRYRSRRTNDRTIEWGWQPTTSPRNSKLSTKHDAIQRLLDMDGPARTAAAARGSYMNDDPTIRTVLELHGLKVRKHESVCILKPHPDDPVDELSCDECGVNVGFHHGWDNDGVARLRFSPYKLLNPFGTIVVLCEDDGGTC